MVVRKLESTAVIGGLQHYNYYCYRVHYPATQSPQKAVELGKPLWLLEEYSAIGTDVTGYTTRVH